MLQMKKVTVNKSKKSKSPILSGDLSADILLQYRENSIITHLSHNDGVVWLHFYLNLRYQNHPQTLIFSAYYAAIYICHNPANWDF